MLRSLGRRRLASVVLVAAVALAVATAGAAFSESVLGVPDASVIYLLAVVALGVFGGTAAAIGTAIAAFVLYDLLFVAPRFTLAAADPGEWLNLVLFLVVGVSIGRLAAASAERAADASRTARENQALFRVSRTLATAASVAEALPGLVAELVAETDMVRVWVTAGGGSDDPVLADSEPDAPVPGAPIATILRREPGDAPAVWVRAHDPVRRTRRDPATPLELYRIRIGTDGQLVGSLWAARPGGSAQPDREETRLLALAADQIGLALRRERLSRTASDAEVARRSDALKSALLDSVSHELRTPLASIRASAGTLADPEAPPDEAERIAAARSIDAEAERLNGIVRNLLDLGRIQGGALTPALEIHDLASLVEPVVGRLERTLAPAGLTVAIDPDLPPVVVDAVYLDEVLTNLLENAARHAPGAPIRITAEAGPDGDVRLNVEDGGPGIAPEALLRLFDSFARGAPGRRSARGGLGIGLSVARGLVEAMGGRISAGRSEDLGGLRVEVSLPAAVAPPPDGGPA